MRIPEIYFSLMTHYKKSLYKIKSHFQVATVKRHEPQLKKDLDVKYVNDHTSIQEINSAQDSWKAKAYSKHEKYALFCTCFITFSFEN